MNHVFFTGGVLGEGVERYAPGGAKKITFDVRGQDSKKAETTVHCFIDDLDLMAKASQLLTAGRCVQIAGELVTEPYMENGRLKGFRRLVRVREAEFPNRSKNPEA